MARPAFKWTDDIESEILNEIMSGRSVLEICGPDRDGWVPSETTFYKHLLEDADFAEKYTRARNVQAHHEVDEIKRIADAATAANFQVARLQVDARKWRASKLAPKIYGDKIELSNDPENPVAFPAMIALVPPGDDSKG